MRTHLLAVLVPINLALAIMSGCARPVMVATTTPAAIPSPTTLSIASATVTPHTAENATAILTRATPFRPSPTVPPSLTPDPYYAFRMTPSEVTVAAGEVVIISGGPADFEPGSKRGDPMWYVEKSAEGAPPYTTIDGVYDPRGFMRPFAIITSCRTPPGTYTLTFHTTSHVRTDLNQSAQARLTVTPPVIRDSPMGTFTTSLPITLKFGGPTSEYRGIADSVTLCDTDPSRRLRITVKSALSEAGTPMAKLPSVGMYRALSKDVLGYIYNSGVGANAEPIYPANDRGEWELAGGPYVIIFGQYYTGRQRPAQQRVGSVTYVREIVQ